MLGVAGDTNCFAIFLLVNDDVSIGQSKWQGSAVLTAAAGTGQATFRNAMSYLSEAPRSAISIRLLVQFDLKIVLKI